MEGELELLERKISELAKERVELIRAIRALNREFDEALKRVRGLGKRIGERRRIKRERRREIRELKDVKQRIYERLSELNRRRRGLISKYRAFMKHVPRESPEELSRILEELEWRIQTEPLSREEEKGLVSRAMNIELKLQRLKRALAMKSEIDGIEVEIERLKRELEECNVRIGENHKMLKDEALKAMIEEREALRSRLDEIKAEMGEMLTKLEEVSTRLKEARERRRELISEMREREGIITRRRMEEMLRESRERIMEKVRRGGKLDFEELKILYGIDLNH